MLGAVLTLLLRSSVRIFRVLHEIHQFDESFSLSDAIFKVRMVGEYFNYWLI